MSIADLVIKHIKIFEPKLTALAAKQRPGVDVQSLRVSSVLCLALTSINVLNGSSAPPDEIKTEIDSIVQRLASLAGESTVRLDHVLLDEDLVNQASSQIHGAYWTNAATAVRLAYSLCAGQDLRRMASLKNGPLGPLGGPSAVTTERLIGQGKSEGFMEISFILTEFVTAIGNGGGRAATIATGSSKSQATGCMFATMAILVGAGAAIAGLSSIVKSIFS